MHFLVCNFGVSDPMFRIVDQELFEKRDHHWILHHLLHCNIVIFVSCLDLLQNFNSCSPLGCGFLDVILHKISKGFTKIFGDVFRISFTVSVTSSSNLLKEADLFIIAFPHSGLAFI